MHDWIASATKRVLRFGFCGAILMAGPAVAGADGSAQLPEAAGIHDECVTAEAFLQTTKAAASTIDQAYRSALYQSEAHVAQAYRLTLMAQWPSELNSTRMKVSAAFVTMIDKLALLERPPAAWRTNDLRTALSREIARLNRTAVLVQGIAPPPPPVPAPSNAPVVPPGPTADFRFTDLSPSVDSRVTYVSSSGSDANDGLTPSTPLKTIAKGCSTLRDGYPDWLLLKRGDTWTGESFNMSSDTYGQSKSGRSQSEPMVIWSYGTSDQRPKLIDGSFVTNSGHHVGNIAVMGLHFERPAGSSSNNNIGIYMLSYGENILLEDLYVSGYFMNIDVSSPTSPNQNVKIRGCVVVDAHSGGSMASGLLLGPMIDSVVEGNVIDHNGWLDNDPNNPATLFNHNMYTYWSGNPITIRNNIVARGSATGIGVYGGLVEENLVLQNGIGMTASHYSTIRRNVFLDGRNIADQSRGFGIWYDGGKEGADIYDNVMAHQVSGTGGQAINLLDGAKNVSFHDNIVYDWLSYDPDWRTWGVAFQVQGPTSGVNQFRNNKLQMSVGMLFRFDLQPAAGVLQFSGNQYFSGNNSNEWFRMPSMLGTSSWAAAAGETDATFTAPAFTDPNRGVGTYNATYGGAATLDAFLSEARKQSRTNWRPAYTAKAVNDYIRAGFDKTLQ